LFCMRLHVLETIPKIVLCECNKVTCSFPPYTSLKKKKLNISVVFCNFTHKLMFIPLPFYLPRMMAASYFSLHHYNGEWFGKRRRKCSAIASIYLLSRSTVGFTRCSHSLVIY